MLEMIVEQLQQIWLDSGNFWQSQWNKILDKTGEDTFTLWVVGTTSLTLIVYWFFGALYTFMDVAEIFRQYKTQPGTNEPANIKRIINVITVVIINQTIISIPIFLLVYRIMDFRGLKPIRELPTFYSILLELIVLIVIEEIGFYYAHRFLHIQTIFKYIHKQHHEWTSPIAITAGYCHPIEHILSNLLPPFFGIIITRAHLITTWIWFSLIIISALNSHSGYHLPFFPSPEAHDFHHVKFNSCYGVLGVLDRLHGTDIMFKTSQNYPRHIMMFSFMPARNVLPERILKTM